MRKFLNWLNDNWKTISTIIATILALAVGATALNSCGSMVKASIRTPKDGTSNTITISTNNPVSITPDTDIAPTITIQTPAKNDK